MDEDKPRAELALPAPVMPLVSAEKAAEQWEAFETLKAKLLKDDDYQAIAGKRFIKRSGFRKLGVYFGLSNTLVKEERTDRNDDSFLWRIVVEVQAPNGRRCIGVGACDSRERKFAHLEHDVYATAFTRALNRATSDMVAGGAVSAEEEEPPAIATAPPASAPSPEPKPPQLAPSETTVRSAATVTGWEVPITKDVLSDEPWVRQFPLAAGAKAVGMLNVLVDGYEASIVPEKPVSAEDPAVRSFLLAKVLAGMAQAHPGFTYEVNKAPDGSLVAVLIRGPLDDELIKELQKASAWSFSKAMERTEKQEQTKS